MVEFVACSQVGSIIGSVCVCVREREREIESRVVLFLGSFYFELNKHHSTFLSFTCFNWKFIDRESQKAY